MTDNNQMLYRFDKFELDLENYELRRDSRPVPIEPLVFDLLSYLVHNSSKVISRDELIDNVWQGRIVSDATVSGCIKVARKILGDSGERQQFIQTVRGRGFKFNVKISSAKSQRFASDTGRTQESNPCLLIRPFKFFGDTDSLEPLAIGLASNLSTILIRVPMLSQISTIELDAITTRSWARTDLRQQFGVNYVLECSL